MAGALYQTGAFTREMTVYVWAILAGSAIGLLASTWGRLYASTYYALQDTRTPLRFALIRVALTIVLGYLFAIPLPVQLGIDPRWGAAGTHRVGTGLAGWVEFHPASAGTARPRWDRRSAALVRRPALGRRLGRGRDGLGR